MASEFEIEKRCRYAKKNGLVQLSPTHLLWTPDSAADGDGLSVQLTSIRQFQVSKQETTPKAMIRIVCDDRDKPIKLDFGNFPDRDSVRDVLNRLRGDDSNPMHSAGAKPRAMPRPKQQRATPLTAAQKQWRLKILGYPEVQQLHAGLVQTGAVTDDDFFEGIKYKFKPNGDRRNNNVAASASKGNIVTVGKKKGIPSHAFNAPKTVEIPKDKGNEGLEPDKWPEDGIPTPSQRHRIFLIVPVAARAYADLIGNKGMAEKKFWDTLRESSLVNKLSTDLRFRRNATATKADAMFAEYFSSNRIETRNEDKEREKALDKSLDIRRFDDHRSLHVLEGHPAFGDAPKITAAPGLSSQPASSHLRIMREVNQHGRMIVDDSTVKKRQGWRKSAEEKKGVFLNDLVDVEMPKFAALSETTVQKAASLFQSQSKETNGNTTNGYGNSISNSNGVLVQDITTIRHAMNNWVPNSNKSLQTTTNAGTVLLKLMDQMRP